MLDILAYLATMSSINITFFSRKAKKLNMQGKKMITTSYSINQLKTRLKPMNLSKVARGSGVAPATVRRVAKGLGDPKTSTIQRISDYLVAIDIEMEK